ncbi:MAG: selenium-dependent molybdenum cofactor biosynthesis protein YqeB [Sphaerochaetaceae bacterium]|jgi:xanthine dehydrogenase accessory factor|nr:selenium-dependent molybdenum cofactor biosynthesis protein YqeB [Sphaerochaetaceae bacterium]
MIDAINETLIVMRGAGDLATGTAIRLHRSGFPVIMLEIEKPTVIRTTVSFAQACFVGSVTVEGVTASLCEKAKALERLKDGVIPIVVDPEGLLIRSLRPRIVIDAILAKRNLGTRPDMADFVLALGPGFEAGVDVHAVIETMRGHDLGRVIYKGSALPNTGIPGLVGGYGKERVMHSPCDGVFHPIRAIGDLVASGDVIAYVDKEPVITQIGGKVRGMLNGGLEVPKGFKVADVDPRGEEIDHLSVSDKARSIAGGALEAVMAFLAQ